MYLSDDQMNLLSTVLAVHARLAREMAWTMADHGQSRAAIMYGSLASDRARIVADLLGVAQRKDDGWELPLTDVGRRVIERAFRDFTHHRGMMASLLGKLGHEAEAEVCWSASREAWELSDYIDRRGAD